MKNLKKVLALALSATMAMSMFVSAGAAYTDAADIKTATAVNMLSALGVINGNPDGTFNPEGTVTRAQMAKMIYTVRNGGNSDASAYEALGTTFTDIGGHWAAGYIKYCQSIGIIAGKSSTSFAPDAFVTGTEAAKMLLVTAGYTADKAGLVGTTWANKTLALSSENSLLTDVDTSIAGNLPRQYAAQIIYNAIDMNTVVYSKDIEGFKPTTDSVVNKETIGTKYLNLETVSAGILTAVNAVEGKDYYTITTSKGTYTNVPTDPSAFMGQNIKVLQKVKSANTTVYGVYADSDSVVLASGFAGGIAKDGSSTTSVKFDGTSIKLDTAVSATEIVDANQPSTKTKLATLIDNIANLNATDAVAGIKLIDNDGNGKADYIVMEPAKYGKVTTVGTSSITAGNGVGTVKFADATIYEGVAKDDYVRYVGGDNNASGKPVITKMDVMTEQTVVSTRTGEAKIDATWYKVPTSVSVTAGGKYDIVMASGFILAADEVSGGTVSNLLFVSARGDYTKQVGNTNGTIDVRAYFSEDGKNSVITVSKVSGTKFTSATQAEAAVVVGGLYTYSKSSSDDTYDLTPVSATNKAGYDAYVEVTTGTAYSKQKINGRTLDDDAIVFVKTGNETKILTGAAIKGWADTIASNFTTQYLTKAVNGVSYIKAATLVTADAISVPGSEKDKMYAYLTSGFYTTSVDGETKGAYDAYTKDGAITIITDSTTAVSGIGADMAISYNMNGTVAENLSAANTKEVAITGIEAVTGGQLYFKSYTDKNATETSLTMADACVYISINAAEVAGVSGGSVGGLQIADIASGSTHYTNAFIITNSDGDIAAVIYDVDANQLTGAHTI